jgi:hypothetical protein
VAARALAIIFPGWLRIYLPRLANGPRNVCRRVRGSGRICIGHVVFAAVVHDHARYVSLASPLLLLTAMNTILDCLVSYFGLDEHEQPTYRRYFCYHIIAGPGTTPGSGVALITTLATDDGERPYSFGQKLHAVQGGGPREAIAKAIAYLDMYHENNRLCRVRSKIRGEGRRNEPAGMPGGAADAALVQAGHVRAIGAEDGAVVGFGPGSF